MIDDIETRPPASIDKAVDAPFGSTGMTPPQYPIESVDRALQLIGLLSREQEVKLSSVRDQLGIGQSTAHRLMAMFVYRGFAVQNVQTLAYRAGPSLYQIGRSAVGAHDVIQHARPALQWLLGHSGETVHLAILAGTEIRYLDVIECEAPLRVTGRVGQIGPAHATSIGKAMLATLDDDDVRARYSRVSIPKVTPRSVSGLAELLAELNRTRVRGWSRNREEMNTGVCSVGTAVVHPTHGLLGGLSIATPKARSNLSTERAHAALLRTAIDRLVSVIP